MEKLDIIKQAEQLLPDNIRNGSIRMNGTEMPLTTYMETVLINILNEHTTPVYVAEIIKNKFADKIILATQQEEVELPMEKGTDEVIDLPKVSIEYDGQQLTEPTNPTVPSEPEVSVETPEPTPMSEEPIHENTIPESPKTIEELNRERIKALVESNGFVKTINPGKGEDWDVEQYLYEVVLPLMNEQGLVCYANKQVTLVEYYEKILEQNRPKVTRADKEHTCLYYLEKVTQEVRKSVIPELGITVEDYVLSVLVDRMSNATDISVIGETIPVEDVIIALVEKQEKLIEEEIAKSYGTPIDLEEITYRPDGTIKLPEKPLPKLTANELKIVTENLSKGLELSEVEVKATLNQLMDYIRKVIDNHNLENVENEFNTFKEQIPESAKSEYVKAQLSKIESMIAEKKVTIARRNNVIDEYGDVIEGMLNEMSRELKGNEDIDVFSKLNGIATRIMIDMGIVGFQDIQVEADVVRAIDSMYFKRLKHDLLIKNQSKDKERLESTIMSFIMDLKQQVFAIQNETRSAAIAGAKIRLDNAYAEVNQFVIDAYESKMINKEEKEHYLVEMDAIYAELNPEQVRTK